MEYLQKLSDDLVALTSMAAPWVVRVNGRRGPNASGLLWSEKTVLTSCRACHRNSEVEVGLPDGSLVMTKVTGRAPDQDLASLELPQAVSDYTPIPWADSSSPGLMVALARDHRGNLLSKLGLIASDELVHRVAAAPEFLGSSLVDAKGQFQGIHLLAERPRVVTREQLLDTLSRIEEQGELEPAFLGLGLHRVETAEGFQCLVVRSEGPSRESGILVGDHLTRMGDEEIVDPQEVRERLRSESAGKKLRLTVVRAGKTHEIEVLLAARPHCGGIPHMIKKHVKKVVKHLHHHYGPHHHHHGHRRWHGPGLLGRRHHHQRGPGGPELC